MATFFRPVYNILGTNSKKQAKVHRVLHATRSNGWPSKDDLALLQASRMLLEDTAPAGRSKAFKVAAPTRRGYREPLDNFGVQ
jgi:hypothetical protein